VDLHGVVEQAVEAAEPLWRPGGLEFTTAMSPDALPVEVDGVRIARGRIRVSGVGIAAELPLSQTSRHTGPVHPLAGGDCLGVPGG
jgi:hypothetical protein